MVPAEERSAGVGVIEPVLLPSLPTHYLQRSNRLRLLADGHPMADYLLWAASLAEAQHQVLAQLPLPAPLVQALRQRLPGNTRPLDAASFPCDLYWHQVLHGLLDVLEPGAGMPVRSTLAALRTLDCDALDAMADRLMAGDYAAIDSGQAPFLWAALSLYWVQMAAHLPASGTAQLGEQRHFCPVCGGAPVASVVLGGGQGGLRYLHCGLCESRWHMVRAKCSNCEETGALDYWSLDAEAVPVKAESCGDCGSYLKVMHMDREQHLEVVADDLASLALDAEMEREGFARSGLNPFLFPGEASVSA